MTEDADFCREAARLLQARNAFYSEAGDKWHRFLKANGYTVGGFYDVKDKALQQMTSDRLVTEYGTLVRTYRKILKTHGVPEESEIPELIYERGDNGPEETKV